MNARRSQTRQRRQFRRERGAVMFITIIVLVVMTLAGIALVRSVDTSNLVAGNLAFHESAIHSGDTGIEEAVKWLQDNAGATLNTDDSTAGYSSNGMNAARSPATGQSWDAYWTATLAARSKTIAGPNGAGNTVAFVIDRMCAFANAPNLGATCASSPVVTAATGNAEVAGEIPLNSQSKVYYRITVKISGPRNTVSYTQATVAL
ncbi:MAG: hypothetical protein ABI831_12775 [Betaproteobacteria bacterium]